MRRPRSPGEGGRGWDGPATGPDRPASGALGDDLGTVPDGLPDDPEERVAKFRDLDPARNHAIEYLDGWACRLNGLVEGLMQARGFDDLTLGWHGTMLRECDDSQG